MIRLLTRMRFGPYGLAALITAALMPALAGNSSAQGYTQTNLVSDIAGLAAVTDPNLVNPWGIAMSPGSPFWVSDNGSGRLTLYNGAGAIQSLVVGVPAADGTPDSGTPTGQVFNGTPDFQLEPGKPALFIACTEDGTISGWNPGVDLTHTRIRVNRSRNHAVYKGLALASLNGANYLYAANFNSGRVEVFDRRFRLVNLGASAFRDPTIRGDYSPFNVQSIGGNIVVTFAKHDRARHDEIDGPGLGFVDMFSTDGTLIQRLEWGPWLNAPWGVAQAPSNFGVFSNALLVGNFGSGWITAFDPVTGNFLGFMLGETGDLITIDGLWALTFGNGKAGGDLDTLYFSAGINDEADGLFGSLLPAVQ